MGLFLFFMLHRTRCSPADLARPPRLSVGKPASGMDHAERATLRPNVLFWLDAALGHAASLVGECNGMANAGGWVVFAYFTTED